MSKQEKHQELREACEKRVWNKEEWTEQAHHTIQQDSSLSTISTFPLSDLCSFSSQVTVPSYPKTFLWKHTCKSDLLHEAFFTFHEHLAKCGSWPKKDEGCGMQQACQFFHALVPETWLSRLPIAARHRELPSFLRTSIPLSIHCLQTCCQTKYISCFLLFTVPSGLACRGVLQRELRLRFLLCPVTCNFTAILTSVVQFFRVCNAGPGLLSWSMNEMASFSTP